MLRFYQECTVTNQCFNQARNILIQLSDEQTPYHNRRGLSKRTRLYGILIKIKNEI
jgi:hypothetical protein